MRTGTVRTANGGELCYLDRGSPEGIPIFWLHGTPGSRLSQAVTEQALTAIPVRVITYDRPGYGLSPRRQGRQVVDSVSDVVSIADHLGIDAFMVSGRSGGAPHALAVAAARPQRVTGVRSVSGFAPYPSAGLDWFAAMDPSNIREFRCALQGEDALAAHITVSAREMLARVKTDAADFLAAFDLADADHSATNIPLVKEVLTQAIPEALRAGTAGWIDDDLAVIRPWGFDVREISVPVELQYGLRDVVVPPAHSQWLAEHIPQAVRLPDPDAGHISTPDQELAMLRHMIEGHQTS
jgi:pimeloyl-ACP methyl ester carboxylesterase